MLITFLEVQTVPGQARRSAAQRANRQRPFEPPCLHIDTPAKRFTLNRMAVTLQIRVESRVAENLKQAAKRRGQTPGAYLRQVVKQAAAAPGVRAPRNRRKSANSFKSKRLSYDLVAMLRDDDGE